MNLLMTGFDLTHNLWFNGWFHFSSLCLFPIDTPEERMRRNLLPGIASCAQTIVGLLGQEL